MTCVFLWFLKHIAFEWYAFCFHLHEDCSSFAINKRLCKETHTKFGGRGYEKRSVIDVARTEGSYTFWVAHVNICFKENSEIGRRERYVFGFRKVSLVF